MLEVFDALCSTDEVLRGKEYSDVFELAALKETENAIAKLTTKEEQINKTRSELKALEWYQNQRPDYQRWQDGEKNLQNLEQGITSLAQKLKQQQQTYHTVNGEYQKLKDQQPSIAKLQEKIADLTKKLPLFAKRDSLKKKINELKTDLMQKKATQEANQNKIANWQQRMDELAVNLKQNEDLPARQVTLVQQQNEQEKLAQAGAVLEELLSKAAKAKASQQELTATLKEAQAIVAADDSRLVELNDLFARHQIALLAQKLKPGSPCPVCGAAEHPQPAHLPDNTRIVSEEEVKTATTKSQESHASVTRIQEQLKQINNQIVELTVQITTSKQEIAGLIGIANLPADWQMQISSRAAQLTDRAEKLAKIKQEVHAWQQESDELQQLVTTNQTAFNQADEEITRLSQQLATTKAILIEQEESLPKEITNERAANDQIKAYQVKIDQYNQQFTASQEKLQKTNQDIAVAESRLTQTNKDLTAQREKQTHLHKRLVSLLAKHNPKLTWEFWQKAESLLPQLVLLRDEITEYENQLRR